MSIEQNKTLVRQFVTRVFENMDASAVDELVSPDFLMHNAPDSQPGPQSLKGAVQRVRKGLSEVSFRIEDLVAEGDKVALRVTAHARQTGEFMGLPPSGKEYTAGEMHLFAVKEGRIAEHWAVVDYLSIMKQLGALPEPGQGTATAKAAPTRQRRAKVAR